MRSRPLAPRALATAALAVALALGSGCAARPVIYPVGGAAPVDQAQLDQDIDECSVLARQHTREGGALARDAARSTVTGGAIGGVSGAVGGAIWGSVGRGAATGAAVGATSGLLTSIFRRGSGEESVQRRFVERCLTERGYDVIGWR